MSNKLTSSEKLVKEFLDCEEQRENDVAGYLAQIAEIVLKHRNCIVPLSKPKAYSLRIGCQEDTVHNGIEDQLEVWEKCYLPEYTKMVVIGALDDFQCSSVGWQLVLMLCKDGSIYAYEFETLHLVAKNLKDLFESGVEFPGLTTYTFGEHFQKLTEDEWEKEMQSDEIRNIENDYHQFHQSMMSDMEMILNEIDKEKQHQSSRNKRKHRRPAQSSTTTPASRRIASTNRACVLKA